MSKINKVRDLIKKLIKEELDVKKNPHSSTLSNLRNQDQSERQTYSKFVQNKFKGDYEKGAKAYAKLKNRSEDDVFGDEERLKKFMSLNFPFNSFSEKDWENYWLLSQHADLYPDFQKNALETITKHLGKDNDYYKYLSDRISCNSKGTQKYGTQNICSIRNN